jgi:glycine/D-amino acid oxidase-like deaminating enzyme
MRVAILGGGFQGCCAAVELAMRGARVTLYDRNSTLLAGAATANEGKIHLGYVYASDPSLTTARTLLRGALSFAPLMQRYLDADVSLTASEPFLYAVHRDSQVKVEDFATYLDATHDLVAAAPGRDSYFGIDLRAAPRRLTQAELETRFDPASIKAAFDTPEIAIDTIAVMEEMRRRIAQDPRIEVRVGHRIAAVEDDGDRLRVRSVRIETNEADSDTFSCVVNTLWDGRLAVDATRGIHPGRKWIHRLKHGIRFRQAEAAAVPSVTIVLGPFGDLVAYGNGSFYLSWYPACMTAHSYALAPPAWRTEPEDPFRSEIVTESFAAMAAIVPGLRNMRPKSIAVKAGAIVAWGSTDIDDYASELHRRHEIGMHSHGSYHSIDSGKLTMVPYFAEVCADRILSKQA